MARFKIIKPPNMSDYCILRHCFLCCLNAVSSGVEDNTQSTTIQKAVKE